MAITTEIKRNCLDGIHSNVLSVLHQILFYIIVALIAITYFELQQSRFMSHHTIFILKMFS